jgi:hypothetical protein
MQTPSPSGDRSACALVLSLLLSDAARHAPVGHLLRSLMVDCAVSVKPKPTGGASPKRVIYQWCGLPRSVAAYEFIYPTSQEGRGSRKSA